MTAKPKTSVLRRSSESRTFQNPDETRLEFMETLGSVSHRSMTIEEEGLERSDGSAAHNSFKNHNKTFHKLFPEIPETEDLENVFTCGLLKEVIYHGKMYVSAQHICFYSTVLLKETKVVIHVSSVQIVRKKHTAKIVPNAVAVITDDGHKYLFVSLLNREGCFKLLQSLCPQPQAENSSRKSSTENTPDLDIDISSQSSVDESHENQLIGREETRLDPQTLQLKSSLSRENSDRKNINTPEQHNTDVSWVSMVTEKVRSVLTINDTHSLNKLLLLYLLLVLLLVLSSGYIGLRILALEQQLSILGSLPEFALQDPQEM